jgi:hypothetical protein
MMHLASNKGYNELPHARGQKYVEGRKMTPENKKSMLWTGVALAAVVIVLAILWAAGVGEKAPATM